MYYFWVKINLNKKKRRKKTGTSGRASPLFSSLLPEQGSVASSLRAPRGAPPSPAPGAAAARLAPGLAPLRSPVFV